MSATRKNKGGLTLRIPTPPSSLNSTPTPPSSSLSNNQESPPNLKEPGRLNRFKGTLKNLGRRAANTVVKQVNLSEALAEKLGYQKNGNFYITKSTIPQGFPEEFEKINFTRGFDDDLYKDLLKEGKVYYKVMREGKNYKILDFKQAPLSHDEWMRSKGFYFKKVDVHKWIHDYLKERCEQGIKTYYDQSMMNAFKNHIPESCKQMEKNLRDFSNAVNQGKDIPNDLVRRLKYNALMEKYNYMLDGTMWTKKRINPIGGKRTRKQKQKRRTTRRRHRRTTRKQ